MRWGKAKETQTPTPPNPGGYGRGGWGWGGGQREGRQAGIENDIKVPWGQMLKAMRVNLIRCGVITAIILSLMGAVYLAFGVLATLILLGGVYLIACFLALRYLGVSDRVLVPGVAVGISILGIAAGLYSVGDLAIPLDIWPIVVVVWVSGCVLYIIWEPTASLFYLMITSIEDPTGPTPPRRPMERMTPIRRWEKEPAKDGEMPITRDEFMDILKHEIGEAVQRNVPRQRVPYPVPQVGDPTLPYQAREDARQQDGGAYVHQAQAQYAERVYGLQGRELSTPDGRSLLLDDLMFFSRRMNDGVSVRDWKDRIKKDGEKWGVEGWQTAIDIFAGLGCVSPRKPKTSTRILIDSHERRMSLLLVAVNDLSTRPPHPGAGGQSVQNTPEEQTEQAQTDQTESGGGS